MRLLWVGRDRTKDSFEKFFTLIGEQLAGKIEFVCPDMWHPYLDVIAKHCPQALNILDRFHMVTKLNKALDEVRAGEARLRHAAWRVTLRKAYGYRTFRIAELSLYHVLGRLAEPKLALRFI